MTHEDIKNNPIRVVRSNKNWETTEGLIVKSSSGLCFLHSYKPQGGSTDTYENFTKYPQYKYSWGLDSYNATKLFDFNYFEMTLLGANFADLTFRKPFKIEL